MTVAVDEPSVSSPLLCLYPECDGTVSFDLVPARGDGPRARALARCTRGHLHYSSDGTRYGTARDEKLVGDEKLVRGARRERFGEA
jgi:hypothetical protein